MSDKLTKLKEALALATTTTTYNKLKAEIAELESVQVVEQNQKRIEAEKQTADQVQADADEHKGKLALIESLKGQAEAQDKKLFDAFMKFLDVADESLLIGNQLHDATNQANRSANNKGYEPVDVKRLAFFGVPLPGTEKETVQFWANRMVEHYFFIQQRRVKQLPSPPKYTLEVLKYSGTIPNFDDQGNLIRNDKPPV